MQVKEIMTSEFEMINSSDSVMNAAKKMQSLNIGFLPVREENRIVGIITDRDIVIRCLAEGKQASDTAVSEVMSSETAGCSAESDISEAAQIMKDNKIRRLIVLDRENRPAGVISLGDIAAKSHIENLVGETLQGVSQPCSPNH